MPTIKQTAKLIGLKRSTVQLGLEKGRYPNKRLCECGNAWLIPEQDIEREKRRRQQKECQQKHK